MRLYLLYLSTRYLAPALPITCGSTYNTFCKVHIPRVYHIAAWLGSSTVGLALKCNNYRLLEYLYLYLYLTLTFKYILILYMYLKVWYLFTELKYISTVKYNHKV